ncbi:MAG: hypothetical protein HQ478_12815 [Chloroflexi bacterium]|nr:hypothetical protein [Chloroflexota bacterium]
MNEPLNSAVKALISDGSLLSKFRRDPAAAMRRFKLSECELDAVKSGDEQQLLAHGMTPELITGQPQAPHWFGGLLGTVARRMAAPAVLAVLLAIAVQGAAAPDANAARANKRATRRVNNIRTFGPSGLRRASVRARTRSNVRYTRAGIRKRASYRVGLQTASAQLCVKCGLTK